MVEVLATIGDASLAAFWFPVIAWSGLAALMMLALVGSARRLHPLAGYRLRQGILLALPAAVVMVPWIPVPELLRPAIPAALGGSPAATFPDPAARGQPLAEQVDVAAILLGVATTAVILLALVRISVLFRDLRRLHRLRVAANTLDDDPANRMLRELADRLAVQRPVQLLEGPDGCVPMTFHWRRPAIVVPGGLVRDPSALPIVLAHELIHVRRHDYVWTLLDCLTSAVFAFHPLTWLLRRGIDRCRETSCDAEVLAGGVARPDKYAKVLVQTHDRARVPMTAVAAGMATRSPTIKERLEAMKQFTDTNPASRLRTGSALVGGMLFLVTATLAGCAGRAEPPDSSGASAGLVDNDVGYSLPSVSDTGQYWSVLSSSTEDAMASAIRRLEIELDYLRERKDELRTQSDAIPRSGADMMPKGEDYRVYADLVQHRRLLDEMYTERLKQFETLRLHRETLRRLRENGP
ncbi:MAG: M56 family metallopeptidase [Gemmatimonadetes bacterium]|nr:M56 family metallopeptidase [Gemmatimonadota bacterium]MYE15910.1 M56 family metallopeptidase [Gemmatimonadota bacterium]